MKMDVPSQERKAQELFLTVVHSLRNSSRSCLSQSSHRGTFREEPIGMMAGIKAMFYQVKVSLILLKSLRVHIAPVNCHAACNDLFCTFMQGISALIDREIITLLIHSGNSGSK